MTLLPIKLVLCRSTVRDSDGNVVSGVARPYQFQLSVGRMMLVGLWMFNTDDKSREYCDRLVRELTGRYDIEVEVKE